MLWPFQKFHNTALFPNSITTQNEWIHWFQIWTSAFELLEHEPISAKKCQKLWHHRKKILKTHKDRLFFLNGRSLKQLSYTRKQQRWVISFFFIFLFCIYCCMTHDVWIAIELMNERKKGQADPTAEPPSWQARGVTRGFIYPKM